MLLCHTHTQQKNGQFRFFLRHQPKNQQQQKHTLTFFRQQGRLVVVYRSLGARNTAGVLSDDRSALLMLERCKVVVAVVCTIAFPSPSSPSHSLSPSSLPSSPSHSLSPSSSHSPSPVLAASLFLPCRRRRFSAIVIIIIAVVVVTALPSLLFLLFRHRRYRRRCHHL